MIRYVQLKDGMKLFIMWHL